MENLGPLVLLFLLPSPLSPTSQGDRGRKTRGEGQKGPAGFPGGAFIRLSPKKTLSRRVYREAANWVPSSSALARSSSEGTKQTLKPSPKAFIFSCWIRAVRLGTASPLQP